MPARHRKYFVRLYPPIAALTWFPWCIEDFKQAFTSYRTDEVGPCVTVAAQKSNALGAKAFDQMSNDVHKVSPPVDSEGNDKSRQVFGDR